jgi:hypothetical protein
MLIDRKPSAMCSSRVVSLMVDALTAPHVAPGARPDPAAAGSATMTGADDAIDWALRRDVELSVATSAASFDRYQPGIPIALRTTS